jgi:hypothetical protein
MAAKKAAAKNAKPKSMGSDRGAQMKADVAKKKAQLAAERKSSGFNKTPTQKKASSGKQTDLAGSAGYGRAVLPSAQSGFVGNYSGRIGRTAQRGEDQSKRAREAFDKKRMAAYTSKVKVAKGKK